jgi:hypothetical protein
MKTLVFTAALFLTSIGCSLPSTAYHGTAAAIHRAGAVGRDDIARHVKVTHRTSALLDLEGHESVVVVARGVQGTGRSGGSISAEERQLCESVLLGGLLEKSFTAASRLNLQPVELERVLGNGRLDTRALAEVFRGDLLLLCTITHIEAEPAVYRWNKLLSGDERKQPLGTRIELYVTLELISARTSETLHITTASLNEIFRENVSRSTLLGESLRVAVKELPNRKPTIRNTTN